MLERILVFVPAYNCEPQIGRVLDQLEEPWARRVVSRVLVVDNRSTDNTAEVVLDRIRARGDDYLALSRNVSNYGLGGSHKVAFRHASGHNFDWLAVLHGDDQARFADFRAALEDGTYRGVDCLLGSRFMPGARLDGYGLLRRLGNHAFNLLYSACLAYWVSDLGSGLNLYRVTALAELGYERHPDDLTFNCALLAASIIAGQRVTFAPISWREDDQVSNVKLLRQALATARIAMRAARRRDAFLDLEQRTVPRLDYPSEAVHAG